MSSILSSSSAATAAVVSTMSSFFNSVRTGDQSSLTIVEQLQKNGTEHHLLVDFVKKCEIDNPGPVHRVCTQSVCTDDTMTAGSKGVSGRVSISDSTRSSEHEQDEQTRLETFVSADVTNVYNGEQQLGARSLVNVPAGSDYVFGAYSQYLLTVAEYEMYCIETSCRCLYGIDVPLVKDFVRRNWSSLTIRSDSVDENTGCDRVSTQKQKQWCTDWLQEDWVALPDYTAPVAQINTTRGVMRSTKSGKSVQVTANCQFHPQVDQLCIGPDLRVSARNRLIIVKKAIACSISVGEELFINYNAMLNKRDRLVQRQHSTLEKYKNAHDKNKIQIG